MTSSLPDPLSARLFGRGGTARSVDRRSALRVLRSAGLVAAGTMATIGCNGAAGNGAQSGGPTDLGAMTADELAVSSGANRAILSRTPMSTAGTPKTLLESAIWGAYAAREPWSDCQPHFDLEADLGATLPVMSWFMTWIVSWPKIGGNQAAAGGYDIQLAWQPELDDDTPIKFSDILAGVHDEYMTRVFTRAKEHPGKVQIRFAHEMNGITYPWSVAYEGSEGRCLDSPEEYVQGWRYVRDFQRRIGGDNVEFSWCIMTNDKGGVRAELYYPGDEYVDLLSMDVYNGYGGGWQEPAEAIEKTYRRLAELSPDKPITIGEIGCREPSKTENSGDGPDPDHNKADWLTGLFKVTDFPRISNVNLFHAERAHDWRLDSTPEAMAVCRAALSQQQPI